VFGVEGSFQGNGSSVGGKHHEFQANELFLFTEQRFVTAETDFKFDRMVETTWNASIGGNVGFCWNRILFYATGGAAFTDAHFFSMNTADTSFFGFVGEGGGTVPTSGPSSVRRVSGPLQGENFIGEIVSKKDRSEGDVLNGYYAGAGTLYQLTNLVSLGLEYRRVNWGDVSEHFMGGNGPVFPGNGHLDLTADQVTFKVNILVGLFGH
jgi:opacity protein-like surface antigen